MCCSVLIAQGFTAAPSTSPLSSPSCRWQGGSEIRNEVEGIEWLKSAACEGDAEAQFELGRCHDEGRGVEQVPY